MVGKDLGLRSPESKPASEHITMLGASLSPPSSWGPGAPELEGPTDIILSGEPEHFGLSQTNTLFNRAMVNVTGLLLFNFVMYRLIKNPRPSTTTSTKESVIYTNKTGRT